MTSLPINVDPLRIAGLLAVAILTASALCQEKVQPQVTVDLKALGSTPDLFTDQSDSMYQQRGVIHAFWLGNDRVAVAFSTNRRWTNTGAPQPLSVHLLIFDSAGKRLKERDWSFSGDGPEGSMTLNLAPGPGDSILAVYDAHSPGPIPDGDYVQVLNADTSLRQIFYIPATSAWVPSINPEPELVLESYFADKRSSLTWWSGNPLKPGVKLDLPVGKDETLAGPAGLAARADCANPILCFGVRVYRSEKTIWNYSLPHPEIVPIPRLFLSSTALLVEQRDLDESQSELLVIHPTGPPTPLPVIPHGLQVVGATGVSSDGRRFAVTGSGEAGICGIFNLWCNQRTETLVIDVPTNRIIFQQGISPAGGTSSLSPDGKHLAIFDRNKLAIYSLP